MAYYGKLANIVPVINTNIKIYGIKIDDITYDLSSVSLLIKNVLYGNVTILSQDTIIVGDTNPVGLVCLVTDGTITAIVLVYFNAVSVPTLPDNFSRLVQKIPKGVFESVTPLIKSNSDGTIGEVGNPQGWDFKARSQLLDDYYNNSYLPLYDELFSRILTSDFIYEFTSNTNFTSNVTTLNPLPYTFDFNSVYPNPLALLMASVLSVGLNQYDLSLFISRYIYYRTGIAATVLLNTQIDNFQYMVLSPEGALTKTASWSLLVPDPTPANKTDPIVINEVQDKPDINSPYAWTNYPNLIGSAYLASEEYQPILNNLRWFIISPNDNLYNMTSELQALINNISRADIGNTLFINPTKLPFGNLVQNGFTYKFDPRFVQKLSGLQYTRDEDFPTNIKLFQVGT